MDLSWRTWIDAVKLIARGATFSRCWKVPLVVGTILTIGNQATNIADEPGSGVTWLRVGFNYVVPFLVASTGYLTAFRVGTSNAPAAGNQSETLSALSGGAMSNALVHPFEFAANLGTVGDALLVPTALLSADTGLVLYANSELADLLGLETVVGRSSSEFFEDATGFDAAVRSMSHTELRDTALTLRTALGLPRSVQVSLKRVAGVEAPGALVMAVHDVTEQTELSTQLPEMAQFPDMNPGPVLRFGQAGNIIRANEAARRIFDGAELLGRSWLDVCPAMDDQRWQELLDVGESSVEVSVGSKSFVFAHVIDSETGAVLAFGSDVTSIKETNRLIDEQSKQLAEFARLPDMNPGPVLKLDHDSTVLLANSAALDLFGADLIGQRWADTCPDLSASDWDEVLESDDFVTVERSVGGSHFIFFHRCDRESRKVFVYGADVTAQRRADELVRLLLASTGEGIYGLDADGRCTFANPAALNVLGYDSTAELLGKDMHDLVHHTRADGEPYPREQCLITTALSEGHGVHLDDEVMWKKDGSSFPVEFWSYPMESNGELVGSVLTFVDISERRRAQEELALAKHTAEAASEAKSQFLANMSHELRTPMNAIIGYSEMLIEDAELDGDEETVADLSKIHSSGRHLLELINNVLDLSKIEAGGVELHIEDFQVEELVRDITTLTRPLVEKNSNRFEVELGDALGAMRSDATKIRQAVMNLISNAAKFTENGVVTLRAERAHREDGDWITLVVSDNGTGIPADKFDHVFEEFAQASSTIARDYGGTGLGLPLTRRFSRLLGGDVHLDSQLGSGSMFTIELPAVLTDGHGHLPSDEAPVLDSDSGIRSPNVLVIDDEPHARELLLRGLEREGYSVTTAADGATGIELARKLRPALITLDIIMPTMDGWAVLAALKAEPETRDIPVAMVSIAPDNDLGIILGAVESLQKPIDRDALTSLVSRYVISEESRLLIVDDDETSRAISRRYGETAGWKCDEAENGAVALERIAECRPDLILLDLMMPVMNGFEMLDELRARSEYRSIPVVVLTARTLTDEDRRRLNGNVERIIEKGHHSTEDLLAYVRNVLDGPSERHR